MNLEDEGAVIGGLIIVTRSLSPPISMLQLELWTCVEVLVPNICNRQPILVPLFVEAHLIRMEAIQYNVRYVIFSKLRTRINFRKGAKPYFFFGQIVGVFS